MNPFEEVFRQAVEYKHTDPINKNVLHHNEDSLHTPQVLGLKENVQTTEEHITVQKTAKRKTKHVKQRTILPSTSRPFIISNGVMITQPQIISITTYPQNPSSSIPAASQPLRQKLRDVITSRQSDDSKQRSKAASSRYRQKSKTEHIQLKKKYKELMIENIELKNRITHLENIVAKQSTNLGHSAIHVEPSTVRFEMSIPKMVILSNKR